MSSVVDSLRKDLMANADQKTRDSAQRFFKEKIEVHGVTIPKVNKIAEKHFAEIKNPGKEKIFSYCEELFRFGTCEEEWVAGDWAYRVSSEYKKEDFKIFESWVEKYIDNWASCDTLCNHAVGAFVEKFPEHVEDLKRWAGSDNRWIKRASCVTLVLSARKGLFLKEVFEIADILLLDPDDLVQKGYGWMLKEASKKHTEEVFDYVMRHKREMPRTALRYAIEKMPPGLRVKAMSK